MADNSKYSKQPQRLQQDLKTGVFKGHAVDVRDPLGQGGARVHCFALHGDYNQLDINAIPWARPHKALRGSHTPPEWGDKLLIQFEDGNQYKPQIVGYWDSIPNGAGTLSFNIVKGTDIRPEGWHNHDLYPESLVLAASGEGCVIWFENKQINEQDLYSAIRAEDTGGKFLRIWSFHPDTLDYAAIEKLSPDDTLHGATMDPPTITRNGTHPVMESVGGAIELGHQKLKRIMSVDDNGFSVDQMRQKLDTDDSGDDSSNSSDSSSSGSSSSSSGGLSGGVSASASEQGIDTLAAGGVIKTARQGRGSYTLVKDSMFLAAQMNFIRNMIVVPKSWSNKDSSSSSSSGSGSGSGNEVSGQVV